MTYIHRHSLVAFLGIALLSTSWGCSAGEVENPGAGGGPGGPGATGNPLDVVLEFAVANDHSTARTETFCASVPMPKGGYTQTSLNNMIVSGHQTAWMPLQFWPDTTVKVAQAQFTDTLEAGETKTYRVARDEPALTGAFQRNPWVALGAGGLQVGAEVRDTNHVAYRGFATGAGTVVRTSPLVQTMRWRTYHMPINGQTGIGRDYLASTFYATEYRDMPYVVVDWILSNDYLGADTEPAGNTDPNLRALGTVDVRSAKFLCSGASAIDPYRPAENAITGPAPLDGFQSYEVMQETWLGDAQTRRYRFLLRFEPAGAQPAELAKWQQTATALVQTPLHPLATQQTWEDTAAGGLVGGPITGPADSLSRARGEFESWRNTSAWFGTWGSRGDAVATATTGTPRNHPMSPELAHAIQGGHPRLLEKLEQLAWAQAMRPYHLWQLVVGAEQDIITWGGTPLLSVPGETLGRRRLRDQDPYPQYRSLSAGQHWAHGWEAFDHEHWSCDLLFDYWTVSGDPWAKEELRQLGQSLKGLMRIRTYYTAAIQAARAEGWCMQGFAQCYLATRDTSLKDYAMRRVNEVVEVQRQKAHPSKAMTFQGVYPSTGWPGNYEFFMPWQHGAVLYGYLGAYRAFNEPALLDIAEDVVDTVQYSWVTNVQTLSYGFVPSGLRYYVPVTSNGTPIPADFWDNYGYGAHLGDSPLGGAHTFLIGGLHLLATMSPDASVRNRALLYGGMLLGPVGTINRWDKWNYCLPRVYATP